MHNAPDAPTAPDALTIAQAAAAEGIDPRSVKKVLRGERVSGLAGARADRAVARLRATNPQPAAP